MEFLLSTNTAFTELLQKEGIVSWSTLKTYVQNLPYGRNSKRNDFSLVLTEKKGTCSSKHALLSQIAEQYKIPNLDLIMGIFKMHAINFPRIKNILARNNLPYIPEAHCYISEKGKRLDLTSKYSNFENIANDILHEQIIKSEQVIKFKVDFHQKFLKDWINRKALTISFEELWKIREDCIDALSTNNP